MSFKNICLSLFLFILAVNAKAQISNTTETDKHIFWQPGRKLTFNDFKGDTIGGKYKDSYKKAGLKAMSYIGLWSILDVPKKKKDRGKLFEKAYAVPAFDKAASYILTTDTAELALQQLYFDFEEVFARTARSQFAGMQDSVKAYGILWTMFSTVIADIKTNKARYYDAITKDIIINKKTGALVEWQQTVHKLLIESKQWATKPEDSQRFITGKPIEKDYEQSADLAAPMQNNKR